MAKGERRKCQRERQEEAGETRDRILRRGIKSWRVQSFLRDDPGNGRAVALLIPLPAANFFPFLLSFFFLRFLWSSSRARRLLVLLSSRVLHVALRRSLCRSFSLSYPSSCIMRSVAVILSPFRALKRAAHLLFFRFDTQGTRNIFIGPRMTHIMHTNEATHIYERKNMFSYNCLYVTVESCFRRVLFLMDRQPSGISSRNKALKYSQISNINYAYL